MSVPQQTARRYRTIVADPPWDHSDGFTGFNGSPGRKQTEVRRGLPYTAMTLPEIAALPIPGLADAAGANLFLWTTNRFLPDAFDVLKSWGAIYRQTLVWFKTGANPVTGAMAPNACEYLLFARIGKGASIQTRWDSPLIITTRGPARTAIARNPRRSWTASSRFPPATYVELFARRARFGWDYWGNESLGTAEMEVA